MTEVRTIAEIDSIKLDNFWPVACLAGVRFLWVKNIPQRGLSKTAAVKRPFHPIKILLGFNLSFTHFLPPNPHPFWLS
jgi:hypothetical protein